MTSPDGAEDAEGEGRFREYYTQPLAVLDLAWELLHAEEVVRDERRPFRTVSSLMMRGGDPPDISHIVDMAVTAYRWRGVPSGGFKCTYCGAVTDRAVDPDPLVCRACCERMPGRACSPP